MREHQPASAATGHDSENQRRGNAAQHRNNDILGGEFTFIRHDRYFRELAAKVNAAGS
jgi:hypothetical protein